MANSGKGNTETEVVQKSARIGVLDILDSRADWEKLVRRLEALETKRSRKLVRRGIVEAVGAVVDRLIDRVVGKVYEVGHGGERRG